jgi:hypothetical protein
MKTLDTLIEDIHGIFHDPSHEVCPENLERFGENCKKALKESIEEATTQRPPTLRMSKIGTPDRKLWYEMNGATPAVTSGKKEIDPALLTKFLYGHILEELVLFLCREAGHTVEGEQDECIVNGVKGHRDAKIDGVVVDVKSASKFAFQKFKTGSLFKDDPFGYIPQISGYVQADPEAADYGAFLAINKETGDLALLKVDPIDMVDAESRISHIRDVVESPAPPVQKCYEPIPLGKAGNTGLAMNCVYCPFKHECWKDANGGRGLRAFQYSNKVEYLTHVAVPPRVPELTGSI